MCKALNGLASYERGLVQQGTGCLASRLHHAAECCGAIFIALTQWLSPMGRRSCRKSRRWWQRWWSLTQQKQAWKPQHPPSRKEGLQHKHRLLRGKDVDFSSQYKKKIWIQVGWSEGCISLSREQGSQHCFMACDGQQDGKWTPKIWFWRLTFHAKRVEHHLLLFSRILISYTAFGKESFIVYVNRMFR